jgi:hypothetical protein
MMTGQAIQEYVYSFQQGGKVVEGLTLAGINEAANRRGGIQIDEVRYEDREGSWIAIVKATDTFTGSSRYGAYEQPKRAGNREDPFAFTKAIHKAQRNAIKQLLPTPVIKEVLNYYLRKQKPRGAAYADSKQIELSVRPEAAPTAEREDTITAQQKAAFSIAQKLREPLEKRGISQKDFWNYVRRRFGVESRNDMREDHWTQLAAEMRSATDSPEMLNQFVRRIEQIGFAERTTEVVVESAEEIPDELDEAASIETVPASETIEETARMDDSEAVEPESAKPELPKPEPTKTPSAPTPKVEKSKPSAPAYRSKETVRKSEKKDVLF